jgi:hypothetical protein
MEAVLQIAGATRLHRDKDLVLVPLRIYSVISSPKIQDIVLMSKRKDQAKAIRYLQETLIISFSFLAILPIVKRKN